MQREISVFVKNRIERNCNIHLANKAGLYSTYQPEIS